MIPKEGLKDPSPPQSALASEPNVTADSQATKSTVIPSLPLSK